tara:strand:- start:855 stop:1391 length:537 start_codon:yes stop_codon:yes gene_type:complete
VIPTIDNKKTKKLKKNGFSLIELVVVVAVLTILSAIAIPSFGDMRKKSIINVAKQNLILIFKECYLANIDNGNATFSDINAWNSTNSFGDRSGLGFGGDGFTYDTGINTNDPISSSDSCMTIAAKSNTISGTSFGSLPHFEIKYNSSTNFIEKNCQVDSSETFNKGTCNATYPSGSQW